MGLDMYAYARPGPLPAAVDFERQDADQEIHYWRKHPNLHGWMERLYRDKGGKSESFNLVPVALTEEDLDQLEAQVRDGILPHTTGFFFGASDGSEAEDDLAFIKKARAALREGKSVYYTSWW